ncbi:MAG: winged helix-turn-helix transcriptional regulator, partial [Clostridia bacterium]|nr:winged helix-turn-helix transcriptional regulator [Clostridia bacterium]
MTETEAIRLFKCLADATRLQIVKSLREEPMYVELLAQRLERTPSTISFHLKKLEEAGVVQAAKEQ